MRLLDDMDAEAGRLRQRAAGYRMTGDSDLAMHANAASLSMLLAAKQVELLARAEGEAREREREA